MLSHIFPTPPTINVRSLFACNFCKKNPSVTLSLGSVGPCTKWQWIGEWSIRQATRKKHENFEAFPFISQNTSKYSSWKLRYCRYWCIQILHKFSLEFTMFPSYCTIHLLRALNREVCKCTMFLRALKHWTLYACRSQSFLVTLRWQSGQRWGEEGKWNTKWWQSGQRWGEEEKLNCDLAICLMKPIDS
jgi:hypothetical protein